MTSLLYAAAVLAVLCLLFIIISLLAFLYGYAAAAIKDYAEYKARMFSVLSRRKRLRIIRKMAKDHQKKMNSIALNIRIHKARDLFFKAEANLYRLRRVGLRVERSFNRLIIKNWKVV